MKRQYSQWENIFTNYTFEKGLISKMSKTYETQYQKRIQLKK